MCFAFEVETCLRYIYIYTLSILPLSLFLQAKEGLYRTFYTLFPPRGAVIWQSTALKATACAKRSPEVCKEDTCIILACSCMVIVDSPLSQLIGDTP